LPAATYAVKVGAGGGSGRTGLGSGFANANASGGGTSGAPAAGSADAPSSGGSGGGGADDTSVGVWYIGQPAFIDTVTGHAGGTTSSNRQAASGGGGAGSAGAANSGTTAGNGGAGYDVSAFIGAGGALYKASGGGGASRGGVAGLGGSSLGNEELFMSGSRFNRGRTILRTINGNNVVTDVAVVQQEFLEANPERYTGTWVETFFDTAGKTYAGIGYEYLEDEQDFRSHSNRILRGLGRTKFGIHQHLCRQMVECIVGMKLI
jgi:hypothetical protein